MTKLLDMLVKLFKSETPTEEQNEQVKRPEKLTIEEAKAHVQEQIFKSEKNREETQGIFKDAMAGDRNAYFKALGIIKDMLADIKLDDNISCEEAAEIIYSQTWGLDVVEKYYRDKEIDEIRVNSPDNIYVVRRGKSERIKESFENEEKVETVIKRMIIDDVGISLDRSSPRIESVRKDGSRLTATCYPVSKTWTFVLRKHNTFEMTVENLIKHKTLDEKTWEILKLLVRGRVNILFSGNVGSGKTSLMRKLIEQTDPALRILVIGKDLELKLLEHYPHKDIIELEEHAYLGASMKELFETALRESPDCIIIEEFRGAGEAVEAIRACTRGHYGSMASAHFNNAEEAVEGTAMMMLEEGLSLPLELAKLRVARAFNVVVQMYGDALTGIKKLVSITEIYVDENNNINYIPLVEWVPSCEEYMGEGKWLIRNNPSPKLITHISRTTPREEIEKAGWDTGCLTCGL